MKKNKIVRISILIVFCLLIFLSLLFFYKNTVFVKEDMIVFIENIKDGDIKEGMGVVYKSERNYNYIVTNYHVIESSDELYVYDYNHNVKGNAEVISFDLFTDIAILKVDNKLKLKKISISKNQPNLNEYVFSFNLYNKQFEKGKIISLNNEIASNGSYYNVGVINSNINAGNSGGPLFNQNNEVIGLIALKDTKTGNGFFMSIDYVMDIVDKLEKGKLYRPKLGVVFTNTSNIELINQYGYSLANKEGIIILELKESSILMDNGFKIGDIFTKLNNKPIKNVVLFQKELYSLKPDEVIKIEFYRNNELMEKNVILR